MRPGNIAAGQDESTIVHLDEVAAPSCARLGADHDEDGRGGDLFTLAGPDVLERPGFQAGLAVAVDNSDTEPDSDVGVAFSWVMRQPDMLAASDSPRTSSVTPGGESGQVQGGLTGCVCRANDAHLLSGHGRGFDVRRTGPGS